MSTSNTKTKPITTDLIDTFGNLKKHIRHTVKAWDNGTAITSCGRRVRHYHGAGNVSFLCTDGTLYSSPCKICIPDGEKQVEAARIEQAERKERTLQSIFNVISKR